MKKRQRTKRWLIMLFLLSLSLAFNTQAAAAKNFLSQTGLSFNYLTRTYTSSEDKDTNNKLSVLVLSLFKDFNFAHNWSFNLSAGIAINNFNGLIFNRLPISLEYQAGVTPAIYFGASLSRKIMSVDEFAIDLTAKARSSLGFKKSWNLQGFGEPGISSGTNYWLDIALGPRLFYNISGNFIPYISVAARYFLGQFEMNEKIGDLVGSQKKNLTGKSLIEATLGFHLKISPKFAVRSEACFLPYSGGIDSFFHASLLFEF